MKKICFIQTSVYPLFNKKSKRTFGGAELQVYLLGKELSKKKFEVSFLTGDFNQKPIEIYQNIKLFRGITPESKDSFIKKIKNFIKIFFLLKKINADIYIQRTASPTTFVVGIFCKLFRKKFIHMVASDIAVTNPRKIGFINSKMYLRGLLMSNKIVAQTKNQKKLLQKIYNINSEELKNSFEIKENKIYKKQFVLWVSRCERLKNIELFFLLAKKMSNQKFIAISPKANFDQNYWHEIKNKAHKIKNLKFIEQVPFDKIQKYFNKSKVFVNTSDYEGFPNTFMQSGLGKTPILSLNVNPDNFITNYNCGYFCDGKKEKLEVGLKILLNDEDYIKRGRNAFEYVKENHDIKKNIKKLIKIINNLNERNS